MAVVLAIAVLLAAAAAGLLLALRSRNMQHWIVPYLRRRLPDPGGRTRHIMFCFVDHFEPMWKGADAATQAARVDRWCTEYRAMAARHRDAASPARSGAGSGCRRPARPARRPRGAFPRRSHGRRSPR